MIVQGSFFAHVVRILYEVGLVNLERAFNDVSLTVVSNDLAFRVQVNIHVWLLGIWMLLLLHSEKRHRLVLLPHHFNGPLSAVEVKLIILLPLLERLAELILALTRSHLPLLISIIKGLANFWPHARQIDVLHAWRSTFLALSLLAPFDHVIDLSDAVLHQHQVSILVGPLLALLLLNPLVQEVNALIVLFFQLSLDALVLNILQPVHLELQLVLANHLALTYVGRANLVGVSDGAREPHGLVSCILAGLLPLLDEFQVIFVEDDFLNIMAWILAHEQALGISFLVPLNDLIFEAQKLQDLLEHIWRDRALHLEVLGHLRGCLGGIHFNGLHSISELVELVEYLASLRFEFALQNLERLLTVQLLPD